MARDTARNWIGIYGRETYPASDKTNHIHMTITIIEARQMHWGIFHV